MGHTRLSRALRLSTGPLALAVVAALSLAQVASAASTITLESASDGRTLKLGNVALDDMLVVTYQERNVSYMRWSTNEGRSFASKVALHGGLPAKDPRVATCNDSVFAVSTWQTASGPEVGVDSRNFVTRDINAYSLGAGNTTDVACFGDIGAVTWVNDGHLWLDAQSSDTSDCSGPCTRVTLDLGTGDFSSPPRITIDYAGFSVVWLTTGLTVQHFDYDAGPTGGFTLTPKPAVTMMVGKGVRYPVIDAANQSVVVAYQRAGRAQIRISDDVAQSFGPQILVPGPCSCVDGGPRPTSVSIGVSSILVEVLRAAGSPLAHAMNGYATTDGGATWAKVSARAGGWQSAVMIYGRDYAEVWDHSLSGKASQYVRFQITVP